MATILLDCIGVLLVDYLPHKTTMTGPYYSELLKKTAPGICRELDGNADPMSTAAARQCTGAHVSSCTSRIVKDIGVEQLSHLPHSTDLAPSDFYLFRHLKKHLRRKRFSDDDEVKRATESYLYSMPQEFYLTGMRDLFGRCYNFADVKGDSIEK